MWVFKFEVYCKYKWYDVDGMMWVVKGGESGVGNVNEGKTERERE